MHVPYFFFLFFLFSLMKAFQFAFIHSNTQKCALNKVVPILGFWIFIFFKSFQMGQPYSLLISLISQSPHLHVAMILHSFNWNLCIHIYSSAFHEIKNYLTVVMHFPPEIFKCKYLPWYHSVKSNCVAFQDSL